MKLAYSLKLTFWVCVAWIVAGSNGISYAQSVTCSLSTPLGASTVATATGLTEPIAAGANAVPPSAGGGTLRVTCGNSGGSFTAGVGALTISLGTPITNTTSHPSASAGIRVSGGTGAFNTTGSVNVGIVTINNSGGVIVIGLGTPVGSPSTGITFPGSSSSSFDLTGVLVSTIGQTSVSASLSVLGTGYAAAPGSTTVISSVSAGILDPTIPTVTLPSSLPPGSGPGPAVLKTDGTIIKGDFTIRIQENYAAMFKEASQFNGGGVFPQSPSSDVQLMLIFSNIPAGLQVSACSATMTNLAGVQSAGFPSTNFTNVTTASPVLVVNFNGPVDLANADVLWVTCMSVTPSQAQLPLPSTDITVQVTLGPTGAALNNSGGPLTGLTTGQTPRYQQSLRPATPLHAVTIFVPTITSIVPSSGLPGDDILVTIFGTNLADATQVTFSGGNINATILGGDDTQLLLEVVIQGNATPGPRTVTVTSPEGVSAPFSSFTVIGQVPKKKSNQITSQ